MVFVIAGQSVAAMTKNFSCAQEAPLAAVPIRGRGTRPSGTANKSPRAGHRQT